MKHTIPTLCMQILILVYTTIPGADPLFSQRGADTMYLPQIMITSLNGYGPYVIGTERSDLFIIYQLPKNTSEVIMKMIDSKGVQVNKSYTLTGSNLETASWSFDSDSMEFRFHRSCPLRFTTKMTALPSIISPIPFTLIQLH